MRSSFFLINKKG